jgi:hypothetical protein
MGRSPRRCYRAANRQRIARSGASVVRHRITPRNVGPNRRSLRGLVAVLSHLRTPGASPWSAQPRPWPSFEAGVSPGDLLDFAWSLQHRLADATSRWTRKHGSPSAGSSIRLRLGTTRCTVGPRRQKRRDALSEKPSRCAVGPHPANKGAAGRDNQPAEPSGARSVRTGKSPGRRPSRASLWQRRGDPARRGRQGEDRCRDGRCPLVGEWTGARGTRCAITLSTPL